MRRLATWLLFKDFLKLCFFGSLAISVLGGVVYGYFEVLWWVWPNANIFEIYCVGSIVGILGTFFSLLCCFRALVFVVEDLWPIYLKDAETIHTRRMEDKSIGGGLTIIKRSNMISKRNQEEDG